MNALYALLFVIALIIVTHPVWLGVGLAIAALCIPVFKVISEHFKRKLGLNRGLGLWDWFLPVGENE